MDSSSDQFSSSSPHPTLRHCHGQYLRKRMTNTQQGQPAESSGSTTPTLQLQLGACHPQTLIAPLLQKNIISQHIFSTKTCPQIHLNYTMMQSNANQQHFPRQTAFSPCSVQSEETSDTDDDCMSTCNSVPKQLSEIFSWGRFFVLRASADHISKSINYAIWTCEGCNEEDMDGICLAAEGRSARLIFFILEKYMGKYRGVAEMAGHAIVGFGNQISFPVYWHLVNDVSPECFDGVTYSELTRKHLIRNDIKNIVELGWKEGLEMIEAIGDKLTRIFRAYSAPTPTAEEMKLRRGVMKSRGCSLF